MAAIQLTYLLIGINVIVFFYLNSHPKTAERFILIADRVRRNKEYDRIFLSGFSHLDILHLLFNMLTLYFFGPSLEESIGATLYFLIFLGSIIAGNLYCLFMRKEDHNYAALGASGGVMGVIYAWILFRPDGMLSLFFLPIPIPGWFFGILFSILSIVLSQLPKAESARISHEGHLGGAFFGGMIAAILLYIQGEGFLANQIYFILGGLGPILIFALVKLFVPGSIYKHLR
ncbi:MAG: rhomboid family intramembrane serine protease [Bacteroidetes bacterium]|nr:rhomboid family intramembrane serine protease [Bacteroidota bacterium]